LNLSLLLSTNYFFPICCTIPNDLENFQAYRQLAFKNEFKELQPFWTFFYTNLSLWSAAAQLFARPKKGLLLIQMLISCNLHGKKFWNLFHIFLNQFTTRSYGYMCPKKFFFKNLVLVLKMAVWEWFWWKHSLKPLGVNVSFNTRIVAGHLWCCPFFLLTPKGPSCVFWQHSNFGQLTTNGVFILFLWNFHTTCGRGISFKAQQFS